MTTYYMRADGSASDKESATSAGAASTAMSVATHNSETFSAGDIIIVSDAGGVYRATIDPPSSGSNGSPIIYQAAGDPVFSGANVVTTWSASTVDVVLDQETGTGDINHNVRRDTTNYHWAVPYMPAETFDCTQVELLLQEVGTIPSGDIWVEIWSDNSGPDEVIANGESGVLDAAASLSGTAAYVTFTFSTPPTLTADTQYYISIQSDVTLSTSNYIKWTGPSSDPSNAKFGAGWRQVQAGTWSEVAGEFLSAKIYKAAENIWEASVTTEPFVVEMDGTYGRVQASTSLTAEYQWYWDANKLYIYSESDPDTAYSLVEAAIRANCLLSSGVSYLNFDGIDFKVCNEYCFRLDGTNSNINLTDCTLYGARWSGLVTQAIGATTFLTVDRCDVYYNGSIGILGNGSADSWTIKHNSVHNNGIIHSDYDAGDQQLVWSAGIKLVHAPGALDSCVVEHNRVYNEGKYLDGTVAEDSVNKGFGIWSDLVESTSAAVGNIFRYNIVHDCNSSGLFCEKSLYSQWYYNLSYNNTNSTSNAYGFRLDADASGRVADNLVYNNTLYGNDTNLYVAGGYDQSGDHCDDNVFKNNICFNATTSEAIFQWGGENDGTNGAGNIYQYNCFGPAYTNFIEWGEGSFVSTYAALDTAYGSSTNSIAGDPLFISTSDFNLRAGSPCIDAGTDVGLAVDLAGTNVPHNMIPDIPDVGAYEYVIASSDSGGWGAYNWYNAYIQLKRKREEELTDLLNKIESLSNTNIDP